MSFPHFSIPCGPSAGINTLVDSSIKSQVSKAPSLQASDPLACATTPVYYCDQRSTLLVYALQLSSSRIIINYHHHLTFYEVIASTMIYIICSLLAVLLLGLSFMVGHALLTSLPRRFSECSSVYIYRLPIPLPHLLLLSTQKTVASTASVLPPM
jgi:hypothetical protein